MSDAVFGPVVTPRDVEKAIENTLKQWHPTYLRFLERKLGLPSGTYEDINSWRSADTMEERFPEQQIPACQVMCTTEAAIYTGATDALGHFNGEIDVLVAGTEPEAARETAGYYAFMLGLALVQHQGLDGSVPVAGFGWESVGVPAVGKPDARWLALGSVHVNIAVEGIFDQEGGPAVPDVVGPPPDRDLVESHQVLLDADPPAGKPLFPDDDVFPDEDEFPS